MLNTLIELQRLKRLERTGWTLRKRKAQRCNKIDWPSVGADRPNAPRRARVVLVSSADRPFKGDEETFDPARPDAALDFDGGDPLELPALSSMLVQYLLEFVAGHLAADHALAELDHRVLVAVRHAMTIGAAPA